MMKTPNKKQNKQTKKPDGNRYKEPQPNTRWNFRNPMEKGEEDLKGSQRSNYTTSKPTESINISPTTSKHVWDQPRSSAWTFRWTPNKRVRDYL
jgi:hypothetical protein